MGHRAHSHQGDHPRIDSRSSILATSNEAGGRRRPHEHPPTPSFGWVDANEPEHEAPTPTVAQANLRNDGTTDVCVSAPPERSATTQPRTGSMLLLRHTKSRRRCSYPTMTDPLGSYTSFTFDGAAPCSSNRASSLCLPFFSQLAGTTIVVSLPVAFLSAVATK